MQLVNIEQIRFRFSLFIVNVHRGQEIIIVVVVSDVPTKNIEESRSNTHGHAGNDTLRRARDGILLTIERGVEQVVGRFFKLFKTQAMSTQIYQSQMFLPTEASISDDSRILASPNRVMPNTSPRYVMRSASSLRCRKSIPIP